jgi:hypothetical protein
LPLSMHIHALHELDPTQAGHERPYVIGLLDVGHWPGLGVGAGHCHELPMHWDEQDEHEATQLPLSMHMYALHW